MSTSELTEVPTRRTPTARAVLPEIQGLRAIAVILVIAFHLWPNAVRGGFVGVDIFFVISGYLITSHLAREAADGRLNVLQFWARRIRRLLPASLLVLAVIAAGTIAFAPLGDWASIFRNIAGSTLYVENWVLANDAVDYWAQAAAAPPTQHYWSLSVEEQFYLAWPIIFLAVGAFALRRRRGFNTVARVVLSVVVVAGFAYSVWFSLTSPAVAYFSTFTRAWEFALGGLLAFLPGLRPTGRRFQIVLGWIGILILAISAITISSSMPFPGWIALLPVLGTACVLVAGTSPSQWSVSGISSWRPIMYTGDISYSLYLWHWPLLVMAGWAIGEVHVPQKLVIVVLTFVLSALMKRYVEDPARRSKWLASHRSIPTFACAGLATAVLVATSIIAPQVASSITQSQLTGANALAKSSAGCVGARASVTAGCSPSVGTSSTPSANVVFQDFDPVIEKCFSQDGNDALIDCRFGKSDHPAMRVALVGDSHAGALAPALMRIADERGWDLHVYLKPGCPWSDTTRFRTDGNTAAIKNCQTWRDKATAALENASPRFDLVVTTSYAIVGNMVDAGSQASPYAASVAGLETTWGDFHKVDPAPIVVVRDNPNWNNSPVVCLQTTKDPASCTESEAAAFSNRDPQIEAATKSPNAKLLDLTDVYCPDSVCQAVIGGITVYRDSHHFSRSFALSLAPVLATRIDKLIQR